MTSYEVSVEVPKDLLSRYLDRRKQDLESCLVSMGTKNFKELEKVGHQLKGNGVTFGYPELSTIGTHLENAAIAKDLSELDLAIKEFSAWVKKQIS